MRSLLLLWLLLCYSVYATHAQSIKEVDICVYGGTAAGVIAAYSAVKMNKTVLLIEPGKCLGGLSSGGLGYTDIGNKFAISGLALDFYRRIGRHYGNFEQWIFEPSVATRTFQLYIKESNVRVLYQYQVQKVQKEGNRISTIIITPSEHTSKVKDQIIKAKMFIDCTYEGDLMARAGVSYTTGRESNAVYGETYNGIQLRDKHQFPDGIDPYKIPGDTSSGLLWGISYQKMAAPGSGDKKIQAYNFRICLTNNPSNRIAIKRPQGYDSTKFELLLRYINRIKAKDLKVFLKMDVMPNAKTDINNNGPISTDMIGQNYAYPEADYETRKKIIKEHENYTKSLLYFIGHDERIPLHLRKEMQQWGYPRDEYINNNHWSPQLYIREARRMIGAYVMTQANCEGSIVVEDGIGNAAYSMDSHNCQRIVIEKDGLQMVKNEGDVQIGGFGPYPIAYRSIIPKETECGNLLVPVCLSASHIAYGSIRMEPVFMVLAQSAAVAAAMAIDKQISLQKVTVKNIQKILKDDPLLDGSTPDILVDDADKDRVVIKGDWSIQKKRSFGPSMLVSNPKSQKEATVQFIPTVVTKGSYAIYAYFPKIENIADQITISITTNKKVYQKIIEPHTIKVIGQTSGEWVYIGNYNFEANSKPSVTIFNLQAKGAVVADAVLLTLNKKQ